MALLLLLPNSEKPHVDFSLVLLESACAVTSASAPSIIFARVSRMLGRLCFHDRPLVNSRVCDRITPMSRGWARLCSCTGFGFGDGSVLLGCLLVVHLALFGRGTRVLPEAPGVFTGWVSVVIGATVLAGALRLCTALSALLFAPNGLGGLKVGLVVATGGGGLGVVGLGWVVTGGGVKNGLGGFGAAGPLGLPANTIQCNKPRQKHDCMARSKANQR